MWAKMNVWINLHGCMVSSLHNFGRTWMACKKKHDILLMEYKIINVSMKFQVIIDVNVNIMNRCIYGMNNVQMWSTLCQQMLKRMMNDIVFKTHNKIHLQILIHPSLNDLSSIRLFNYLFASSIHHVLKFSLPIVHTLCSTIHIAHISIICHKGKSTIFIIISIFPLESRKQILHTHEYNFK